MPPSSPEAGGAPLALPRPRCTAPAALPGVAAVAPRVPVLSQLASRPAVPPDAPLHGAAAAAALCPLPRWEGWGFPGGRCAHRSPSGSGCSPTALLINWLLLLLWERQAPGVAAPSAACVLTAPHVPWRPHGTGTKLAPPADPIGLAGTRWHPGAQGGLGQAGATSVGSGQGWGRGWGAFGGAEPYRGLWGTAEGCREATAPSHTPGHPRPRLRQLLATLGDAAFVPGCNEISAWLPG